MLGQIVTPEHKRSKSFLVEQKREEDVLDDSCSATSHDSDRIKLLKESAKTKKEQSPKSEARNSLKQEILQLEKRLQDQFEVRRALENALGYRSSRNENDTSEASMPKPATELIKEISVLELEVVHLEQYLLSLYRKAFDQQISTVCPSSKEGQYKSPILAPKGSFFDFSRPDSTSKRETTDVQCNNHREESTCTKVEEKLLDSGVQRCHSSLSRCSTYAVRNSPPERACYSQPLSMMEYAQNATNIISLAEHLGTQISDHIPVTPNKLSEDMIKCISAIYCKLSHSPSRHNGLSSPNSSMSSASGFSPKDQCDMWSPGSRNYSSFDVRLDNPFHIEGLKDFSGPYSIMIEVPWIYRDTQKSADVEPLLQNFRSLICRLEEVHPGKLEHDEKLAFWINVHNALAMHAFLAYGIPQNNVRRLFLLLKAAYNIGGHTISADTIQSSILGCRMSRPGQWIRLLLPSKSKFKIGDDRQAYVLEHAEPLLYFALCSGSHSDPAVRVYTPKSIHKELESAKEEYIRASFGMRKGRKTLLPKIIESYAKDSGLCQAGVIEMVHKSLPDSTRKSIKKGQLGKSRKSIEWVPHNFAFRYLISKELVR